MDDKNINSNQSELDNIFAEKAIEKTRGNLLGYFITHFRIVILVIASILILGAIALVNIPRESDPEVKIPIAIVSTFYPGASPADVESLLTDKIEKKLEELENVKLITSSSRNSLSSIVVEFAAEADLDASIRELKDKVGELADLPTEAENPVVTQIRANDYPIITFSLSGTLTESQFRQLGKIVQRELEAISGVSKAPLLGTRDREIVVLVDKVALSRLDISLSAVLGAIRASDMDLPLGELEIDGLNYNIRALGRLSSVAELSQVVVSLAGNQPILLGDIARISEEFVEQENISRISIDGQPAENNISLQIFKKSGGNILNIVDAAKDRIDKLQTDRVIPANVKVEINNDYSSFIREDLNTLGSSGLQATFLIFAVMFIALSFKEALIALVSIPLTLLITFIVLYFSGYTLNSMSLYALVLSLGLLVDTFIVILEGIFHNIRLGYSSLRASLLSVANYAGPVTSGVLTTIAAFFPMLLVSGILGEYLKIFPITIGVVLTASLFVSLALVPSFASVFLRKSKFVQEKKESVLERHLTNRLRAWYRVKIVSFLADKKARVKFSLVISVLFIASLGVLVLGIIPVQLFPKIDMDFVYIDIKMPVGTNLKNTEEVLTEVEAALYDYPEIKNFVSTVGQSSSIGSFDPGSAGNNVASVSVNFVDKSQRKRKSYDIVEAIRKDLEKINRGDISVQELSAGPPTGAAVEMRIKGDDLLVLDSLTNEVKNILSSIDGLVNISSNQDVGPADLSFRLNRNAIAQAGFSVSEVASSLRLAIFGVKATAISQDGDEIDVVVRVDKNKISSLEEIKNLSLINNFGQEVKLAYLADFSLEPALTTIRHYDFSRAINISADMAPGYVSSRAIVEIEEKIKERGLPPDGYEISFGGEMEDIEQSFSELWNAMILAVLLILIILVLEFNSFIKPLIIFMSLPLMLIGVVVGMAVFNLPFSFMVFLGLVSLTGIGVNNAIVLMDKANRNMEEKGMSASQAIADAGDTRLQPIFLTTITTIFGIMPLAFASEFWLGLSIAIIFGLAFASVVQLFVVPMLFVALVDRRKK
ncbi:MAG: efflux RND transporter permease subunit [Patescibacteria group bacterium]|nr:efflux RND transporter permease subunit [Patescibacteria group bacterium]